MKRSEYKMYLLRMGGMSIGSVDAYEGDPVEYARSIAQGNRFYPMDTVCELYETWQHKVGRSWVITETTLGTWTLAELLVSEETAGAKAKEFAEIHYKAGAK